MTHEKRCFSDVGRLRTCRRIFAGTVAALALSAVARAAVNLPWEYDFKGPPPPSVGLPEGSKIVEDGAGGRVLSNSADYIVLSVLAPMNYKMDESLRVTVTAASGEGPRGAKLGLIGRVYKGNAAQPDADANFGWNRKLKAGAFSDEVFDATIPENLRRKGDGLFLMFYRSNKVGTLEIKKVKIEVEPTPAAPAETAKASPTVMFPYSIFPEGTGDSLKLDFFPVGVVCGGEPEFYAKRFASEGGDPYIYIDRTFKEIAELGANFIHFQGGALADKNGQPVAGPVCRLAAKYGLKTSTQLNDAYFYSDLQFPNVMKNAGVKNSWEYFHKHIVPHIEEVMPQYRDDPNIWAWAPVEELGSDQNAEWTIAEYRRLIWTLCPKARIFEIVTNPEAMKAMKVPYPNVLAVDRYCWWNSDYGGEVVMWTPNMALRTLRGMIRPFMEQAERQGRPCLFCMQSCAEYHFLDNSKSEGWDAAPKLKTPEEREHFVIPEIPSLRYYPKLDKFGRWTFYLPPQNAMRAMCWIGVLEGAKGLICWHYWPGPVPGELTGAECLAKGMDYRNGINKSLPCWADLKKGFAEVKPYGQLFLALHKEPVCGVTVSDPAIWTNTFKDADGRRFAILVNGRIATWDKTSPDILNYPETKLNIDDEGNLINYEVAPPITFTATLPSEAGATLQPLRDGTPVKPLAGGYELTLEPGQGVVLYIGQAVDVGPIKARYGLELGK